MLIQRSFESKEQEQKYMSVAFWANLVLSLTIWFIIVCFNAPIAKLAGNEGYGHLLVVAGVMIPLYGIVGIQNARIKKQLDFRRLFVVRFIAAFIPLIVTVPLALIGFEHWALIIGNIASIIVRAVLLFIIGRFVPSKYFSASILKDIFSSAIWTTLDGLAVWSTSWLDIFLISNYMTDYQLGLYKNSTSTITSLLGLVTSAVTPVMFSVLSKLKDQDEAFRTFFLKVQKTLCLFILPMGLGIFFYRELATDILFGNKWYEASEIVGIFALTSTLRILFVSIYSDAYIAKGKFYLPLMLQIIDLAVLVPACMISARSGFWSLVYARSFVKLDLIIPEAICIWLVCGISIKKTMSNIMHPIIASAIMSFVIVILQSYSHSFIWNIISIIIASLVYLGVLLLFKEERKFIRSFVKKRK